MPAGWFCRVIAVCRATWHRRRIGQQESTTPLLWILAITSLLHALMIWGEVSLTHATAHARLAIWEMVQGRYKSDFWLGMILSILGGLLPWLALFGLCEHRTWSWRRANGFGWIDALRERLRAGGTIGAAGVVIKMTCPRKLEFFHIVFAR